MNIFVYQVDDDTYGAGMIESVCASRGEIVEIWSCDTEEQIQFIEDHGSAYNGVRNRVIQLAVRAKTLIDVDDYEFDDEREAVLLELASLPFKSRFKAGIKVIFGRYQETVNATQGNH